VHIASYGHLYASALFRQAKDETIAWPLWYNLTRMQSARGYSGPFEFDNDRKNAVAKAAA
jgi:hypothetical protein